MKLLVFDTETTSLKPGQICQLSYITIDASTKPQVTKGNNIFISVDEVDPSAEAIHGFSAEKLYTLSEGKYFEDVLPQFESDFQGCDFVIGHNVNFDVKFMKHELSGMGIDYVPKRTFCTMQYYRDICRLPKANGEIKNPKLEEVIKFLKITKEQISATSDKLFQGSGDFHDARFDTAATYLLIIEGIKQGYIPAKYFTSRL